MRFAAGVALAGVALAACAGEEPTVSQAGTVRVLMSERGQAPVAHDSVDVSLWRQESNGMATDRTETFGLDQFSAGVRVSFNFNNTPPAEGRFRGARSMTYNRLPIGSASLSVSGGAKLYDRKGAAIRIPDVHRLREEAKLPAASSRPQITPVTGPAPPGPRRYVTRVVTPERARDQLEGLRSHAYLQEAEVPGQMRFTRTQRNVTQSWVFDQSIGAVVEMTVDRDGHRWLLVRNQYQQRPDGYVLTSATSTWFGRDGQPNRRATERFVTPQLATQH